MQIKISFKISKDWRKNDLLNHSSKFFSAKKNKKFCVPKTYICFI